LTTPPQPYEPETEAPPSISTDERERVIENVAKEFKLKPEKVAEVVRNAT
jgi:predicted nuclease of restriction endonuclease-like RecB superfamily